MYLGFAWSALQRGDRSLGAFFALCESFVSIFFAPSAHPAPVQLENEHFYGLGT